MRRFRTQLTVFFILVIGLAFLAPGYLMSEIWKNAQLDSLREGMFREMRIIMLNLDWQTTGSDEEQIVYFTGKSKLFHQLADLRVTFIRADGKVLGDSDQDPRVMENHGSRPEVLAAKADGSGSTVRYSRTLSRSMIYAALPVKKDGRLVGYIRLSKSLDDIVAADRKIWKMLGYGLSALFVVAVALSFAFARSLSRKLEKVASVAQEISRMNYGARIEARAGDEIGELGKAINRMAASLEQQMIMLKDEEVRLKSVIEHLTSGIVLIDRDSKVVLMNRSAETMLDAPFATLWGKRIDKLLHVPGELIDLVARCLGQKELLREEIVLHMPEERIFETSVIPMLQSGGEWMGTVVVLHDVTAMRRLEQMRSEFVANVSHELKTPVTAIKGFAETLMAGAKDDSETAQTFLKIIFDESERLNRLIEDILELSKIESKRAGLNLAPVHLPTFTAKMVEMLAESAKKKSIKLEQEVRGDLYIEADEDRLQQIFFNLISNGISYTPEGGRVWVTVEEVPSHQAGDADRVRITVKDTGIGIPKKDLPRIFERFYRVDKARSRGSGGTGLGLSIVKHLVDLHKGTIAVESMVGAGSSFIVELPVLQ